MFSFLIGFICGMAFLLLSGLAWAMIESSE